MKKILVYSLLCMLLCCACFALPEIAAVQDEAVGEEIEQAELAATSGTYGSNITWSVDSYGTIKLTGSGSMEGKYYPEAYPWYSSNVNNITRVEFGYGITNIPLYIFYGYPNITSVSIPNTVTKISSYAFSGCTNLSSITIPSSVTYIDGGAFSGTGISSIVIPNGITYIRSTTFYNCSNLRSVTIPSGVTKIAGSAFSGCTSLTTVYYCGSQEEWEDIDFDTYGDGKEILANANVVYNYQNPVSVSSVSISRSSLSLEKGDTYSLSATVYPSNATNKTVTWSSSSTYVATVSSSGVVTAKNNGTATITVKTNSGAKTASCVVTVSCIHNAVVDSAVAPTCTTAGATEGKHCSKCGAVLVSQTTIHSLGHDYNSWRTRTSATCIYEGVEYRTCQREECGYEETKSIPKLSHNYNDWEVLTEPTCTATGTNQRTCQNSYCGYVENSIIDALGHVEVVDNAVTPTCTRTGLTQGKHCSRCKTVLAVQQVISALGHIEIIDVAVAPTCTKTGLTQGKHCSRCTAVLEAQEVISALGHVEIVDIAVGPTCTTSGLTQGKHCSRCNTVLVAQEVVSSLGHVEVIDEAVEPTYTSTGLTKGKHCSRCDMVLIPQYVIPMLEEFRDIHFTIGTIIAQPGSTVKVPVTLTNTNNINSFAIRDLEYDNSALEFLGFEDAGEFSDGAMFNQYDVINKTVAIGFMTQGKYSGKVCDLVFRVKDDAPFGDYQITATPIVKRGSEVFEVISNSGLITVSVLLGDIDLSGNVDINDALLLYAHSMMPDLYPIEYTGDTDFVINGVLDIDDATRLYLYSMMPDLYELFVYP